MTDDDVARYVNYLRNHAGGHPEYLSEAADMLLALKARAEAAEKEHQDFRLENDREWKAKVDYQKARAEAAEKERDALRKSYPVDLDMDAALRRAEAAEKECDRLREQLAKCYGNLMAADQRIKELGSEIERGIEEPWESAPIGN